MDSVADPKNDDSQDSDDPFIPHSLEELDALIPGYQFVEFIDRGGMGAVYKAVQKSLNRMVAVKLLPRLHRDKLRFAERFTREARALALLNHPHIVSVYDSGETKDGHMFYAMEFVAGTDLNHLLRREPLSPRQILTIVTQVCEAVQFAHEHGVVHRDIKPANILIDERGNVKVADFGLAKIIGRDADSDRFTATGTTMGTPDYIAPEAMKHEVETDHRADIYSLGVMIYEMLTGQIPKGVWEPPSKHSGADTRLDEVVNTAMQNDPAKRFQHVSDMTQVIQKLLQLGEDLSGFDLPRPLPSRRPAGPSADAPTMLSPATGRSRRRTMFFSLGAAALVAGAYVMPWKKLIPSDGAAATTAAGKLAISPAKTTAATAQVALAKWVFNNGGFVNAMGSGSSEHAMGEGADLYAEAELPAGSFSIWRVNVTRNPISNDSAFQDLIALCLKAGTVENLVLRNSNIKPTSLLGLQELELLTNIDLTGSTAVTDSSMPYVAGCKNLALFRLGGSSLSDADRVAATLRSLRPDCEVIVE